MTVVYGLGRREGGSDLNTKASRDGTRRFIDLKRAVVVVLELEKRGGGAVVEDGEYLGGRLTSLDIAKRHVLTAHLHVWSRAFTSASEFGSASRQGAVREVVKFRAVLCRRVERDGDRDRRVGLEDEILRLHRKHTLVVLKPTLSVPILEHDGCIHRGAVGKLNHDFLSVATENRPEVDIWLREFDERVLGQSGQGRRIYDIIDSACDARIEGRRLLRCERNHYTLGLTYRNGARVGVYFERTRITEEERRGKVADVFDHNLFSRYF